MVVYIANTVAQAAVDAIGDNVNSGFFRGYSGSVPADADAALGGATLLFEITFGADAFPAASDAGGSASAQANATTEETSAPAGGTCSFWRIYNSAGTVCYMQGLPGDLTFSSTTIGIGDSVDFSTELTLSCSES